MSAATASLFRDVRGQGIPALIVVTRDGELPGGDQQTREAGRDVLGSLVLPHMEPGSPRVVMFPNLSTLSDVRWLQEHSREDCPVMDIMNFRSGIFSPEPPKDL